MEENDNGNRVHIGNGTKNNYSINWKVKIENPKPNGKTQIKIIAVDK